MEVVLGLVIGIVSLLAIVFSRLITTFIHELGHTIAALVLTDGPVEMYVGSYGNESRSLKLKLGRLTLFLSFIIWDLEIGLCRHKQAKSTTSTMIVILSGPLLSLLLGALFLLMIAQANYSNGLKFVLSIFMISSIWDFLINMIPRDTLIRLHNGSQVKNDGRQFLDLIQERKLPAAYSEFQQLLASGKVAEALVMVDELLLENPSVRAYHEAKLDILSKNGSPQEFLGAYDLYNKEMKPSIRNIELWAESKIQLHDYDVVVKKLTEIIYQGKGTYDLQFKRGRALVELGEYYDALRDFHALTLGKVEDPRALANRAYCQFKLGYEDEAREDITQALSKAKGHLGEIYYLAGVIYEPSDEDKALTYYKKAESLKYPHHALPFNISRIEKFK